MSRIINKFRRDKPTTCPPSTTEKTAEIAYDGAKFEDDFVLPSENAVLGNGQFGVVKACFCKKSRENYCVKEIERKMIYNNSQQQAENELMKKIQHPNIVRLVQIYIDDKYMKIVMDRAFGGDLLDRILGHPQTRLSERLTRFFVWQVLCSLEYLHSKNIAHRDLKPENVLLSSKNEFAVAKVCDFGYARIVGEQSFMQSIVGTPAYWAPEVRQGQYSMKVDLWSTGVLCYVAISGTFPFEESDGRFDDRCLEYSRMYPKNMPCWSTASEESKDFITKCMLLDEGDRLDVAAALNHPWLQNATLKKDLEALEKEMKSAHLFNSNKIN